MSNLEHQADQWLGRPPPRGADAPSERGVFRFIPASELLAEMRAPVWHIRKVLEADTLGVVYGAPEAGKSFVTVDWACCIATGLPWRGHGVKQGPALVVIGEGRNGYARRLAAWSKVNGTALEGVPLHVSSTATALTDPVAAAELEAVVAEFTREHGAPVLIVVDTLARNFGSGDENSSRDMQAAITTCDALRESTGASVVLVHHAGKDATRGARGSGALRGAADCEFMVTRDTDGLLRFESTKMKDAARPDPIEFRFESVDLGFQDSEGEAVTSAVLVEVDGGEFATTARDAGLGSTQRRALQILNSEYERCRANLREGGFDPGRALVFTDRWRELLREDGTHKQAIYKAVKSLAERGFVKIEGLHAIPAGAA